MGLFDKKSKFAILKEFVISEESAQPPLMKLLELYDFDIDGEVDPEMKKLKQTTAENLLEFFRFGYLSLDDDGTTIIQKLKRPPGDVSEIRYPEFTGRDKRAMDKFKKDELQGKAFALVGSVSKLGDEAFDKLKKFDLDVAENIGMLFLL